MCEYIDISICDKYVCIDIYSGWVLEDLNPTYFLKAQRKIFDKSYLLKQQRKLNNNYRDCFEDIGYSCSILGLQCDIT